MAGIQPPAEASVPPAAADLPMQLLVAQLKSPDRMVRMKALVMVVRKCGAQALPVLEQLAVKDESTEIRYYARKAINMLARDAAQDAPAAPASAGAEAPAAQRVPTLDDLRRLLAVGQSAHRRASGAPGLAAGLGSPPDPDREAGRREKLGAVKLALQHGMREAAGLFSEALSGEQDPVALSALVLAVGKLGGPEHARELIRFLRHEEPRVRANAIEGIEAAGDPSCLPYVIACLRDEDNRCRANAAKALKGYGPVNQIATLRGMLQSQHVWMQDSATYVLGFLGSPETFVLFKLAIASPFRVVREQARSSLQRLKARGNERAADLLARMGGHRHGLPEEELMERLSSLAGEPEPAAPTPGPSAPEAAAFGSARPEDGATAGPSGRGAPPAAEVAALEPRTPTLEGGALRPDLPAGPGPGAPAETDGPGPGGSEAGPEVAPEEAPAMGPARPSPQERRKTADEVLSELEAVESAGIADLDFLVKDELRQESALARLAKAASGAPAGEPDPSSFAVSRAQSVFERLSAIGASGDAGELPVARQERRSESVLERLGADLAGVAGAASAAEAFQDRAEREDAIFARLRALA